MIAITHNTTSLKPSISLATTLKPGETLPGILSSFWKQSDMCPIENLGGWSLPAMLLTSVVLSHGLGGKLQSQHLLLLHPWFLALLMPLSTLSTIPSGVASIEPFLTPTPHFLKRNPTFSWGHPPTQEEQSSGVRSWFPYFSLLLLPEDPTRVWKVTFKTYSEWPFCPLVPHFLLQTTIHSHYWFIIFLPTPVSATILGYFGIHEGISFSNLALYFLYFLT